MSRTGYRKAIDTTRYNYSHKFLDVSTPSKSMIYNLIIGFKNNFRRLARHLQLVVKEPDHECPCIAGSLGIIDTGPRVVKEGVVGLVLY